MVDYDPSIIQTQANRLYSQAKNAVMSMTIVYVILGLVLGYFLGTAFSSISNRSFDWLAFGNEGLIGAIIGAILFGLLGLLAGRQIAFKLKLQAQIALCQLRIEENTRRYHIEPTGLEG